MKEDIYNQVMDTLEEHNQKLFEIVSTIKTKDTLATARTIKTDRIKLAIKSALLELLEAETIPTKYKVHKSTNIAYITLNKYYNPILEALAS